MSVGGNVHGMKQPKNPTMTNNNSNTGLANLTKPLHEFTGPSRLG